MNLLVLGGSGNAGGAVIQACLQASDVREVRAIARRSLAFQHPKLVVALHEDFLDYSHAVDLFKGLDACFFRLGVSATQVTDQSDYRRITKDFAVSAAKSLREQSPPLRFTI